MIQSDKRLHPRYLLKIPVRFRCFEIACGDLELSTEALNISRGGLFMTSRQRLKVESWLSMTLRVPTEISGSVYSELRCTGRVVHAQDLGDGRIGYGIEFERAALPVRPNLTHEGYVWSMRI
jgi:hypothetical protein